MPPPVRWKLPFACSSLLALALVLAGAAFAGNGGIAPPAETPNAERIRDLYWLVLAVTGVIFVVIEATLVMFVVKYRSRGRPREEEGPQIRGHTRLELIWTVIPVLILAAIISVVFYKLPGIASIFPASAGTHQLCATSFAGAVISRSTGWPVGRRSSFTDTAPFG
jgi:cytochrome c oxidase subunit 2